MSTLLVCRDILGMGTRRGTSCNDALVYATWLAALRGRFDSDAGLSRSGNVSPRSVHVAAVGWHRIVSGSDKHRTQHLAASVDGGMVVLADAFAIA